jgi:hypothetical protein
MAESFSDIAIKPKGAEPAPAYREPIEESFREGEVNPGGGGRQEVFSDNGKRDKRRYGESVLAKIDAIEKRERGAEVEDSAAAPSEDAGQASEAKPADAPPPNDATLAPSEPPPPPHPDMPDIETIRAERDRFEQANKALIAELEASKKTSKAEAPALHKMLAEALEMYVDDPIGATRRLAAAAYAIEDLSDKRLTDEIRDLYTDLTAHILGVSPEASHQAKREAARARQLLAREKRERKAAEDAAARRAQAEAETRQAEQARAFIGNRLAQSKDAYPYLHALAQDLDGMKPEAVVLQVIQREIQSGRIPKDADDEAKITTAAKLIETHYKSFADKFNKAIPQPVSQPSTAQPSIPTTPSASKEQRQQTPARTLTTADASVAPATPPAPKTEMKPDKPPSFKNQKAHREWALRRIPK